jgi:hypothetical protein
LFADFTLTNTLSVPAALAVFAGAPQSTAVTTAFPVALSAKVTDSGGNPLAGFTVNFAAPTSGSSAALSATTAITNTSGVATVNAVANGVIGAYNVTASLGAFTANFGLTNSGAALSKCDVNMDGATTVPDVQLAINQALGVAVRASDLNGDGAVTVVDGQIVLNAVLNLGCAAH